MKKRFVATLVAAMLVMTGCGTTNVASEVTTPSEEVVTEAPVTEEAQAPEAPAEEKEEEAPAVADYYSVVNISINPEFNIYLDEIMNIVYVVAVNLDAQDVMNGLSEGDILVGTSFADGCEALVKESIEKQYLTTGKAVNLSVIEVADDYDQAPESILENAVTMLDALSENGTVQFVTNTETANAVLTKAEDRKIANIEVPVLEEETAEEAPAEETTEVAEETAEESYTVTAMDTYMYAQQAVNLRKGPSVDYDKAGSLERGEKVHITGQASTGWYQLENGAFVTNSAKYIAATEPAKEVAKAETSTGTTTTTASGSTGAAQTETPAASTGSTETAQTTTPATSTETAQATTPATSTETAQTTTPVASSGSTESSSSSTSTGSTSSEHVHNWVLDESRSTYFDWHCDQRHLGVLWYVCSECGAERSELDGVTDGSLENVGFIHYPGEEEEDVSARYDCGNGTVFKTYVVRCTKCGTVISERTVEETN